MRTEKTAFFSCGRWLRGLGLIAVSLLGAALVIRALVALTEALAVLLLAIVVASLALPHRLGWYWQRIRVELAKIFLELGLRLKTPEQEEKEKTEDGCE